VAIDGLKRRGREWQERLLALRDSVGELFAAEGEALSRDLGQWGKAFGIAVLLLVVALMLLFWLLALLVAVVAAVLAIWLPVWGAMMVTAGALALVIGGLAFVGWRRLAALEGPLRRVQRRWRDHADWWQERVFDAPAEEEPDDEDRSA
jgi:hypothetical protein